VALSPVPPARVEPSAESPVPPAESSAGLSGGGGIPGARVNLGDGESPGTLARPTAARPVAVDVPPAADSSSTGAAEDPVPPDFAWVSVIN